MVMSRTRIAAGGDDFERALKFLMGLGTLAGIMLWAKRFLR
jgi:hypothetical protein